ncbi:MAG: archaeosortase A, partial [Methanosarcinales archaeon]|nr:archaeosortase A [Methanosarcinales archaeon]
MLNKPVVLLTWMIGGLMENVLWISLLLLLGYTLSGRERLAGAGWVMFGFYWLSTPEYYLHIQDYFNVALTLLAAAFSF